MVKVGSVVTKQPARWWDGAPVAGWPRADMLGTVRKLETVGGVECAWVRWSSGRRDLAALRELTEVRQ